MKELYAANTTEATRSPLFWLTVSLTAMKALRKGKDLESNPGTSSGRTLLRNSQGLVKRLTQVEEGESVPLTAPGLQVDRATFLTLAVLVSQSFTCVFSYQQAQFLLHVRLHQYVVV